MSRTLIKLFKLIISIIIITFAEKYFFDILSLIKVDIKSLTFIGKEIAVLILYILIFIGVYFLYKKEINNDFSRYKRNIFPNILMAIVFFVVLTLILAITDYVSKTLATSFHVNYIGIPNVDIFHKKLDVNLIFYILKYILIIPFTKVIVYVVGIKEIFSSKNKALFFSGLLAAIIAGIQMSGSFINILFNVIPYFILYIFLTYIYVKNNTNIWYSLITFWLYTLFASMLLAKIL